MRISFNPTSYIHIILSFFLQITSLLQSSIYDYYRSMKNSKRDENRFLDLTDDLLLDIMYQLPVRSLGRCKAVCKSWNSLISDPDFVVSHLECSKGNDLPVTLVVQRYNVISSLEFDDPDDITEGVSIVELDQQFVDDEYDGYCFAVGSCDGLLCVYLRENKRSYDDSLYLWNPATNEEMEVSLPVQDTSFYLYKETSWFGFVPSSEDYKIFLVLSASFEKQMYLYSFRSRRWREILATDREAKFITSSNSVYMEEALHYLVLCKWIVKFDLVAGSFEKIPFSIKPDELPENCRVSLGVIREYCLCAMFMDCSEEWMYELWTLEEYGNWDSWEKCYKIDLQEDVVHNCLQFLGFTYSGELCINKEDGLMLVDPMCDPPSYVSARDKKVYDVMDYVESLISPRSLP